MNAQNRIKLWGLKCHYRQLHVYVKGAKAKTDLNNIVFCICNSMNSKINLKKTRYYNILKLSIVMLIKYVNKYSETMYRCIIN